MYYTDDSILPENMQPLIITVAPFGPQWLPGDADIPVTWDEQVQTAVDCYNAGATNCTSTCETRRPERAPSISISTITSSGDSNRPSRR